jgi:homoprotocatechuate degradation regulator HpaR
MRAFKHSLPMSLLKAREAVMKNLNPLLRKHDLSPQQWYVLRALYKENNVTISMLSERCELLMPSLSRIISKLEERRLITRRACNEDQRRSINKLTAKGNKLVESLLPETEERLDYISKVLGDEKLGQLYSILNELVEKLGDGNNEATG